MQSNTDEMDETACCNVIIWDVIISMIMSGFALAKYTDIHWILSIILGIVAGLIIGVLMMVRFLGTVIQLGFSIILSVGFMELLDKIFGIYKDLHKYSVQMWVIRILLVLIIFAIHLMFNNLMFGKMFGIIGEKSNKEHRKKRDKHYDNLEMEFYRTRFYNDKLDSIRDRLYTIADKKAISYEEWKKLNDVFMETVENYNSALRICKPYLSRPKEKCKNIDLIVTDIRNKNVLIDTNVKNLEQDLAAVEKRIAEEERKRSYQSRNNNYQEESHNYKKEEHNNSNKSDYEEKQNDDSNREQQSTEDTDVELFFAGCNDIESIGKRHRQLMKIYHPDNSNGDNEMCKKVQSAYERLCRKYKKNN